MIEHVIPMTGNRPYPPRTSGFTKTFWDGIAEGRFQTTTCTDCQKTTFPPKPICPACMGANVEWKEISGRGTIYSYTIIHAAPSIFAHETPYAVGIVDTPERLRIGARLLIPQERLQVSMPVAVGRMEYEDGPFFGFVEAEGHGTK
ncbi:MAG: OB-fold domain-containing protein [Rhodobacteraceae bacterium]|nr:OB-fold domain-containing protein [Paracoccaceae bacterium]